MLRTTYVSMAADLTLENRLLKKSTPAEDVMLALTRPPHFARSGVVNRVAGDRLLEIRSGRFASPMTATG